MDSKGNTIKQTQSWTQKWAIALIKFLGWKIHNTTNPTILKKAVIVLAPHTSNWDFFYGILFKLSYPDVVIKFAIKKEVMFFPLSYLMKMLGAIPIDRSKTAKRTNIISTMTEMFHQADKLLIAITPEGTRRYVKRWKTGFYRLSKAVNIPIILGYINYSKKEIGMGPTFHITGDMEKDIANIQDFYRKIPGKCPEQGVL